MKSRPRLLERNQLRCRPSQPAPSNYRRPTSCHPNITPPASAPTLPSPVPLPIGRVDPNQPARPCPPDQADQRRCSHSIPAGSVPLFSFAARSSEHARIFPSAASRSRSGLSPVSLPELVSNALRTDSLHGVVAAESIRSEAELLASPRTQGSTGGGGKRGVIG